MHISKNWTLAERFATILQRASNEQGDNDSPGSHRERVLDIRSAAYEDASGDEDPSANSVGQDLLSNSSPSALNAFAAWNEALSLQLNGTGRGPGILPSPVDVGQIVEEGFQYPDTQQAFAFTDPFYMQLHEAFMGV